MFWSTSPFRERLVVVAGLALFAAPTLGQEAKFPSFEPENGPPDGWTGRVFELSQDYPVQQPESEELPWDDISFVDNPWDYLRAVLDYGVEGNDAPGVDWDVAKNQIRTWYHAPWLHTGCAGREFIRGLTRERTSRPDELYPGVEDYFDNWAVGIYSAPGGYVLGRVWNTASGEPDPALSVFPVGTVALKLLFTTATPSDVPFLEGSLEWEANIYPNIGANPCGVPERPARVNRKVYLLQIDVAIRDRRKNRSTGWVFGTFIYDGASTGTRVWDRMAPVGLMWTNDPDESSEILREGAFNNDDLKDTILNQDLIAGPDHPANAARMTHFGLGGRLNGPVDNPISSCMSCHGRGSWPTQSMAPPGVRRARDYPTDEFEEYFKTIPHGAQQFVEDGVTRTRTDYSLQVMVGIRNYHRANPDDTESLATSPTPTDYSVREGGPELANWSADFDTGDSPSGLDLRWIAAIVVALAVAGFAVARRKS